MHKRSLLSAKQIQRTHFLAGEHTHNYAGSLNTRTTVLIPQLHTRVFPTPFRISFHMQTEGTRLHYYQHTFLVWWNLNIRKPFAEHQVWTTIRHENIIPKAHPLLIFWSLCAPTQQTKSLRTEDSSFQSFYTWKSNHLRGALPHSTEHNNSPNGTPSIGEPARTEYNHKAL